jgi:hypothetical protein
MEKIFRYIAIIVSIVVSSGCEETLELYDSPDNRLNFYYESSSDSVINYTFVYEPLSKITDTVWVTVLTMGFLSDTDREVAIEQVPTSGSNAVAGTHYLQFGDASVKGYYMIKAGANEAKLPVVVKRDASLKNQTVSLLVRIAENSCFKTGYAKYSRKMITITDQLSRPSYWGSIMSYYLGEYGPVKHQFMIDVTGKKIDNDYFYSLGFSGPNSYTNFFDSNYIFYMKDWFNDKLAIRNGERAAQGLSPLSEADGTLVSF